MILSHFIFFPFFGFGFVMYFLPSIIALARSKRDLLAIFLLNLFGDGALLDGSSPWSGRQKTTFPWW